MIFLDIETAPQCESFESLSDRWKELWADRHKRSEYDGTPEISYLEKSSLRAEFAKVVSVAIATVHDGGIVGSVYTGDDEKAILDFVTHRLSLRKTTGICAHSGISFDFPFLYRRFVAAGMFNKLPPQLIVENKKPWEMLWYDTARIWSCGEYRDSIPLDTLCEVLGVKSPKESIKGSDVGSLFWNGEYDAIRKYNAADVTALVNCYHAMHGGKIFDKVTWTGKIVVLPPEGSAPPASDVAGDTTSHPSASAEASLSEDAPML